MPSWPRSTRHATTEPTTLISSSGRTGRPTGQPGTPCQEVCTAVRGRGGGEGPPMGQPGTPCQEVCTAGRAGVGEGPPMGQPSTPCLEVCTAGRGRGGGRDHQRGSLVLCFRRYVQQGGAGKGRGRGRGRGAGMGREGGLVLRVGRYALRGRGRPIRRYVQQGRGRVKSPRNAFSL